MSRSPLAALLACLAVALPCAGCGDACNEAAEKAEDCGITSASVQDDQDDFDCEGQIECSAECVNQATCAELQDWNDPDTAFSECVRGCETQ